MSEPIGSVSVEVSADLSNLTPGLAQAKAQTQAFDREASAAMEHMGATAASSAQIFAAALASVGGNLKKITPEVLANAKASLEAAAASNTMATSAMAGAAAIGKTATATKAATAATEVNTAVTLKSRSAYEAFVLVHEALSGRLSRIPGSLMVMANAQMGAAASAKLLSAVISPMGLAIIAAGAATIFAAVSATKYAETMSAMANVSAGVGKQAGLTGAALEDAAKSGAAAANVSISSAEKQALSLAATGKMTADVIQGLIGVSRDYAKLTGQDVATAVKTLGKDFEDPAKGAEELTSQLGFLSDAQLQHIKLLSESGDKLAANRVLMVALTEAVKGQATEAGGLAGLWHNVTVNVSNFAHEVGKALDDAADHWNKLPPGMKAAMLHQLGPVGDFLGTASSTPPKPVPILSAASLNAFLGPDPNTPQAHNQASVLAGNITRSITPGGSSLEKLTVDLAKANEAVKVLAKTHQDSGPAWQSAIANQERYNHAVTSYLDPAAKAHAIAQANIEATKAHTPAQKALAAAHKASAEASGEAMTASEIATKAADASTLAEDRALKKKDGAAERIKDEVAKLKDEASSNRDVAEAYDLSTAAGFKAAAMKKASADATRLHTSALKFEGLELAVAVTAEEASGAKALAADQEKIAAQLAVNKVMAAQGVDQAEATKLVGEDTDMRKLQAAAANATAEDLARLTKIIGDTKTAQLDLNRATLQGQVIADDQKNSDSAAQIALETKLLYASNAERDRRLAMLKEEQRLRRTGGEALVNSPEGQRSIANAGSAAAERAPLQSAQFVKGATDQLTAQRNAYLLNVRAIGMTTAAAAAFEFEQSHLNDAALRGITLSQDERTKLHALAQGYGEAAAAADELARRQKGAADAANYLADEFDNAISSVLDGSTKGKDAIHALVKSLDKSAIDATLTGKGPFAGILGTDKVAGPGQPNGGVLSQFFGKALGVGKSPTGTAADPIFVTMSPGLGGDMFGGGGSSFGDLFSKLWGGGGATGAAGIAGDGSGSLDMLAGLFHNGMSGNPEGAPQRAVNPRIFLSAPRLHSGLEPDEFPAILQRGERVQRKGSAARGRQAVNIYVSTPDAASFGRSQGQISREAKRHMQRIG